MSHLRYLVEVKREEIKVLVRRHRGQNVSLFGSVARADEHIRREAVRL